ncbi:transcriptional regulator, partial [Streptomyces sp. NPDC057757]
LQQRDLERACETGTQAVRLLSGLRSNRGVEYLDEFRRRLEPYREQRVVREFHARADAEAA